VLLVISAASIAVEIPRTSDLPRHPRSVPRPNVAHVGAVVGNINPVDECFVTIAVARWRRSVGRAILCNKRASVMRRWF
jgi:hypothetical protein